MADQGPDRVAAVVARVETTLAACMIGDVPSLPLARRITDALDAAGLLLTAARRERIVEFIQHAGPEYIDPVSAERHERHRDALLRELAGERDPAPNTEEPPRCTTCGAQGHVWERCPRPAPRRMAGNPVSGAAWHMREHDEDANCADHPPCQPVAPHDSDPWEATRDAAYREAAPSCAEHDDPIREGRIVDYIDEQGVEWTRSERVRRTMPPAPTHEHRWAPIAWEVVNLTATRVTREHCTRGDCTATREVGHG